MATSKAKEVEPRTGASFPVTLDDGKKLTSVGLKRPSMLGIGVNISSFLSDDTKITTGSVLEISRLSGYVLEAKLWGEVVSKVESELLSRTFINMYLGESDVVDEEAKETFGASMLSLF